MHYLLYLSGILLLVGAAMGMREHPLWDWVYLVGGVGYALHYLWAGWREEGLRARRLSWLNTLAGILFAFSALLRMGYLARYGTQLWIVALLLGLIYMIYANLVVGRKK